MLGSLSGSRCCAARSGARPAASSAVARPRDLRPALMCALFPVLDLEFRLLRARMIGDLDLEILGADTFLEPQIGTAPIVAFVGTLAVEQHHQLVCAGLEIADVESLHAALDQRRHFPRGIQV